MNKEMCMVCSAVSFYLVDLLNTNLQLTFEKLTDLKVNNDAHYLCFICNRRLQQCYQLQQLAINKNQMGLDNSKYEIEISKSHYPLLHQTEMILKVKQEICEENGDALATDVKQNNLDYLQEQEIRKKDESSKYLSLQSGNTTYCEMGLRACTPVVHNIVETDQLDINSTVDNYESKEVVVKHLSNSKITLNNHLIVHAKTEKQYRCNKCYKTLSQSSYLIKHKRIHTYVKQYSCDMCNKNFYHKNNLMVHIRTHSGEKPYSCDMCNKTFSQKINLIRHIKAHMGEKPYSCDMCNRTFSQKNNLIRHKRTHTGDKPYCCNICKNTFSDGSSLISHKRTHTGEKPYSCDICNKTFSTSSNLISHKRTHTGEKPYSCDICNRTFSQKPNLLTHIRTHTGNKPYSCDMCNKTFSRKNNLIRHKRIHTGDKPYSCSICKKTFSDGSSLKYHKRTHTGEKP